MKRDDPPRHVVYAVAVDASLYSTTLCVPVLSILDATPREVAIRPMKAARLIARRPRTNIASTMRIQERRHLVSDWIGVGDWSRVVLAMLELRGSISAWDRRGVN